MRDLKIAVVGGGIGGLTAALSLGQAGYDVSLYERAPEITPIGAGISLWPNGVKVMQWLGVGEELAALAPPMRRLRYLAPDGEQLTDISLAPLESAAGQRAYPIARTDIQLTLLRHLGDERVTLDATCVGADQDDDGVTVRFADGREVRADVLVGADGVRSALREQVIGEPWPPRYAGNVNWNGLVPADEAIGPLDAFTLIVGEGRRCGFMPVSEGRFYFFFDAAMPADSVVERGGWRAELEQLFRGWGSNVHALLDGLDEERMVRHPIHDLEPLPRFADRRIALLGDAAHAATPMLGQGAAMAMEDAVVLTRCLVTTDMGIAHALERYESQRSDRAHAIARASRERTELMIASDPVATERWYAQLRGAEDGDVIDAMTRIVVAGPFG
ncbi:MAG TPA: FAD-dependent monooxygenase [Conexibacter sp.]|nr:FAD-dependent monooxygenase [Conexibacter sp.]